MVKKLTQARMIIRFTIHGNQEDPNGNAIPKIKKTARQQWTPAAQRYQAWKEYVRRAFYAANNLGGFPISISGNSPLVKPGTRVQLRTALYPISLAKDTAAQMTIEIHWANEKHADPESVFGSIADAIFENDKHVAGSFTFVHAKDKKGKVEVEIKI